MRGFRIYWEALRFNDPNSKHLQQHPYVTGATFGIEIEFLAITAPFEEMRPEWLALGLNHTDFEDEFVQSYQHNDPDYEKDDNDFIQYIRMNKKKAWDTLWEIIEQGEFRANEYDDQYKQIMIKYWGDKLKDIIKSAGYRIDFGAQASGQKWAVGSDGQDSEFNLPIIEIRSGIMNQGDMENLSNVLQGISALCKQYPKELMARGNTGLHIHVANPRTKPEDAFSRLAAAQTADEDAIWDTSARHDRAFDRYATLNRPQDFESTHQEGTHDKIINMLQQLIKKAKSIVISDNELNSYIFNINRNSGINITSEHPTVEYRYLSSMLIVENPQKVIQFIQYFINHTASMSNKDQIKFENDDVRFVLTKQPNQMIRINVFNKKEHEQEWEDENGRTLPSTYKYPKVPRVGLPRADLDKTDTGRGNQPFSQWFNNLDFPTRYKMKKQIRKKN